MEHAKKDMKENKDTRYFEKEGMLYLKKGNTNLSEFWFQIV